MTENIKQPVSIEHKGAIGVVTIDYAPVNALSQQVRVGLFNAIENLDNDKAVKVIIIRCQGNTFIAGADIKEFGKPASEPFLPDLVNRIEATTKPVIASLFGTSLGGGFEVALACHYRLALSNAKVGLPEVNLGLIPGAGGTQRLMRILGPEQALAMITSGRHYNVSEFSASNLFDQIIDGELVDLEQQSLHFAKQLIDNNELTPPRVGDISLLNDDFNWQAAKVDIIKKARGKQAPVVAFDVLEKTHHMTIADGMVYERQQFLILRSSEQSAALIHAFSAEKQAAKLLNNPTNNSVSVPVCHIANVGIIGGGNMGSGIATCFLMANFNVQLIEQSSEALVAGLARISNNFASNVKRGAMTQAAADDCLKKLAGSSDYQSLSHCDLVLEAVFEDIEVKKALFKKVTSVCKAQTILATNTSYLDIDEIAASISYPQQLVGMHFFSPANIMKLLEVVKAKQTSEQVIATAMQVGKQLKKISVLVGVCFGFAGNRMYTRYGREVQQMLLEGARVEQIDHAMTQWGMAMGPLAVQDLSGIDIGHNARSAQAFPQHDKGYFRAAAALVAAGRLGRKTQAGFYQYDQQGKATATTEVTELLQATAQELQIQQRVFTDEGIVHRALFALISEGFALLEAGIVQRISDIDVIWLHGYGFPRYKGGPMFQAAQLGKLKVEQELNQLADEFGQAIWPKVNVVL